MCVLPGFQLTTLLGEINLQLETGQISDIPIVNTDPSLYLHILLEPFSQLLVKVPYANTAELRVSSTAVMISFFIMISSNC